MKKIIILFILAVIIASCNNFTSTQRYEDLQYFLTGLLIEGKTIDFENPIIIGKTIPAEGGYIDDLLIFDASVMLFEFDQDSVLVDSTALCFAVNPTNQDQFGYVDLNENMIVQDNYKYLIKALIGSTDLIFAQTSIPRSILVEDDPGYTTDPTAGFPEISYDTIDQDHPIQITTLNNDIINLHTKIYCLEEWQNAKYIHTFGDEEFPEDEDEYENPGDGSPRKAVIFYTFQPENNLINFGFYQYAFVFYGRYQVTVSSIDDNYMQYLYKPEGYNHGGINGGIGYFGSASSYEIYTKVIEE